MNKYQMGFYNKYKKILLFAKHKNAILFLYEYS